MSSKSGKKSRRKMEAALAAATPSQEAKALIPTREIEIVKIIESVKPTEEEEAPALKENVSVLVKEVEVTPEKIDDVEIVTVEEAVPKELELLPNVVTEGSDEPQIDEVMETEIVTNGTNGTHEDLEIEMEPLVVEEADQVDPELQFDEVTENSDVDSRKSSPVLVRCRTRRSQTRNIPTPKTPKLIEPELEKEFLNVDLNETTESTVSTRVMIGSDVTREIDLTLPDDKDSFLNTAKELTVVETLRRMTSRRSIRSISDYRRNLLKSKVEKADLSLPSTRSSVEKLTGVKRKNRSETPDGIKRYKVESSPSGFMSYISSPISKIKSKFSNGEVSASTPKLTGYKRKVEDPDFTKIENEDSAHTEKKWCVVM